MQKIETIPFNIVTELRGKSILPFWSSEIKFISEDLKLKHLLIPMDSDSIQYLVNNNIPFALPDYFLTEYDKYLPYARAKINVVNWINKNHNNKIIPTFYRPAMYQLAIVYQAEIICKSWLANGIASVHTFKINENNINGSWNDFELAKSVWNDMLGSNFNEITCETRDDGRNCKILKKIDQQKNQLVGRIRRLFGRIRRLFLKIFFKELLLEHDQIVSHQPISYKDLQYFFLERAIVFQCGCAPHPHRDIYIIEQLLKIGKVCVLADVSHDVACELKKKWKVPIITIGDLIDDEDLDISNEIDSLLSFSSLSMTTKLLKNFMLKRCAYLKSKGNWLKLIFSVHRPLLIVSTQTIDHLSKYIERMCLDMNIPVLGVPHSAIQDMRSIYFHDYDPYLFITTSELNEVACSSEASSVRITSINNLYVKDEYKMDTKVKIFTNNPIILFVFVVSQLSMAPIYIDGPYSRLKLISSLYSPPDYISDNYRLLFKLHPIHSEISLWKLFNNNNENILPLNTNLDDILDNTSVFVSVNYVSSPVIQAITKQIPVILLNTTSDHDFNSLSWYTPMYDVLKREDINIVYSVNELWEQINNLCKNNEVREDILQKQNNIKNKLFPSKRIDLQELISEISKNTNYINQFPLIKNES